MPSLWYSARRHELSPTQTALTADNVNRASEIAAILLTDHLSSHAFGVTAEWLARKYLVIYWTLNQSHRPWAHNRAVCQ
jgi:hypothetical protein